MIEPFQYQKRDSVTFDRGQTSTQFPLKIMRDDWKLHQLDFKNARSFERNAWENAWKFNNSRRIEF